MNGEQRTALWKAIDAYVSACSSQSISERAAQAIDSAVEAVDDAADFIAGVVERLKQ